MVLLINDVENNIVIDSVKSANTLRERTGHSLSLLSRNLVRRYQHPGAAQHSQRHRADAL
jgi:hypothetical protein